jgi:hypothetical protein
VQHTKGHARLPVLRTVAKQAKSANFLPEPNVKQYELKTKRLKLDSLYFTTTRLSSGKIMK